MSLMDSHNPKGYGQLDQFPLHKYNFLYVLIYSLSLFLGMATK